MGSVHSKISGSASSRPRGWQQIFPPLYLPLSYPPCIMHEKSHAPPTPPMHHFFWAEALEKLRLRPCGRIDGNWISFQLANSTPPLSVTDSAFAPSARMPLSHLTFFGTCASTIS